MSALGLRILACFCMLLDHLGYCFSPRWPWMKALRWVGRLAFPLFVFLMVNGFRHTSNRLRYALRMGLFALLSQIPFALFCGYEGYFERYNVFVTLLMGLLTIWATDSLRKNRCTRYAAWLPGLCAFALCYFGVISADYGPKGILLALTFYLFDEKPVLTALGAFVSVFHGKLISWGLTAAKLVLGKDAVFSAPSQWEWVQLLSLLALIFIWLYRGKPGHMPENPAARKAIQLGFYFFYPAHMLLLWWIR